MSARSRLYPPKRTSHSGTAVSVLCQSRTFSHSGIWYPAWVAFVMFAGIRRASSFMRRIISQFRLKNTTIRPATNKHNSPIANRLCRVRDRKEAASRAKP